VFIFKLYTSIRVFLKYTFEGDTLSRSIKIALVVGSILATINHVQDILSGQLSWHWIVPMLVTYLVPFSTATFGQVQGKRQRDKLHSMVVQPSQADQ
jgi:hypothetical protein